jgi:1-deoxy-D-xylulose-5-phosphate reductoisomerase
MVRYRDGSVLAQMGQPDMRTPIAFGLAWPERIDAGVAQLNLTQLAGLSFSEPNFSQFPCLSLAFAAAKMGGTAPAILNAANEIAVAAFLDEGLPYLKIAEVVEHTLNTVSSVSAGSLETILAADAQARQITNDFIRNIKQ